MIIDVIKGVQWDPSGERDNESAIDEPERI
jgi:hypothetical protein